MKLIDVHGKSIEVFGFKKWLNQRAMAPSEFYRTIKFIDNFSMLKWKRNDLNFFFFSSETDLSCKMFFLFVNQGSTKWYLQSSSKQSIISINKYRYSSRRRSIGSKYSASWYWKWMETDLRSIEQHFTHLESQKRQWITSMSYSNAPSINPITLS